VSWAIARRKDSIGAVTAIDRSPYLVAPAKKLAHEEGLGTAIALHAGDCQSLGLENGTLDAVVAPTLLSHVQIRSPC
jgi:ubiquinone/menaquinone biosynthesis C-methylase UbiE